MSRLLLAPCRPGDVGTTAVVTFATSSGSKLEDPGGEDEKIRDNKATSEEIRKRGEEVGGRRGGGGGREEEDE